MNIIPSTAIITKDATETSLKTACLYELLSMASTSPSTGVLSDDKNESSNQKPYVLLKQVLQLVEKRGLERNITDWTFANFWGNPYEPLHSKLLRYFINPNEKHLCGSFLLRKLLEVLKESGALPSQHVFPVDNYCDVAAESEYIDLRIERYRDDKDGKYVIIIENKINGAINQNKQLQTYAERVRHGERFKSNQIFVLYLPLNGDQNPNKDDEKWLNENDVWHKKITFEKHILDWLNAVFEKPENAWPENMTKGMSENLGHYRNLIRYLINKQKESKMNCEILKKLQKLEDRLPSWSQVENLYESAAELQNCFKIMLRGKLLFEIRDILKQKGDIKFCQDGSVFPAKEIILDSPYDERLGNDVNLFIQVDKAVSIGFGCGPSSSSSGFWIGYMKSGNQDEQNGIQNIVASQAKIYLKKPNESRPLWYAWDWVDITYENSAEKSSCMANQLIKMYDSLLEEVQMRNGTLK